MFEKKQRRKKKLFGGKDLKEKWVRDPNKGKTVSQSENKLFSGVVVNYKEVRVAKSDGGVCAVVDSVECSRVAEISLLVGGFSVLMCREHAMALSRAIPASIDELNRIRIGGL